jgi:excisionase family DNA binding protein
MSEPQLGRSVTIDRAASLLHVSRRTIYNRIREGRLQTIRTIGGSQRVLVSSLEFIRNPGDELAVLQPLDAAHGRPDAGRETNQEKSGIEEGSVHTEHQRP